MSGKATKIEFLGRVARNSSSKDALDWLRVDSSYVAQNVRIACEALSLKLVRLVRDNEIYGYILKITPGGLLLSQGRLDEAATAIDTSTIPFRIMGDEPYGPVAVNIYKGGPSISLDSLLAKNHASEIMRCIATGHILVKDGRLRAADIGPGERGYRSLAMPVHDTALERRRQAGMRRG